MHADPEPTTSIARECLTRCQYSLLHLGSSFPTFNSFLYCIWYSFPTTHFISFCSYICCSYCYVNFFLLIEETCDTDPDSMYVEFAFLVLVSLAHF